MGSIWIVRMQETESPTRRNVAPAGPIPRRHRRRPARWILPFSLLAVALILVLLVPFLNVNRFQRRIVTSLSQSLGRPIHLDRISLTLFPLPGLTIDNLVVAEDPAFGAEPFVRAGTVRARLRIGSLWRRRVEFSRISFADPSINLVKSSQGKWNIESILLQAARIDAAPTGQARPSAAPRFPYIEATGARLNLKRGLEKTPFSLTEAEFALWLNSPGEWRLRLDSRPLRTDISPSEIGTIRLEGTLGRAAALSDVPVDLRAEWRDAPLGEASRVTLGHDAGLRGSLLLITTLRGTLGRGTVQSTLHLTDLRRADFVPTHSLALDAECLATESALFAAIEDLRCTWPPALTPGPKTLALTGSIPDTRDLAAASFDLGTPGIPAATLLDWLHIATFRVSPDVTATGTLTGSLALRPAPAHPFQWSGQLTLADGTLTVPSVSADPVFEGDLSLRSVPGSNSSAQSQFVLSPLSLSLGDPDFATLDGHLNRTGFTLHLTGTARPARLLALGAAQPQVGDGLGDVLPNPATSPAPIRFDLTSTRTWGGPQTWKTSAPTPLPSRRSHSHSRR